MIEFEDKKDFSDGCAIVYGGSGGLGQSICRLLAVRGTPVAVSYRSRKAEADAVVEQIKEFGGDAIAVQADLRDVAS